MLNAENIFSLPREAAPFTRHGLWETVRINQSTHTSASNPPTVSIAPPPGLQWCCGRPRRRSRRVFVVSSRGSFHLRVPALRQQSAPLDTIFICPCHVLKYDARTLIQ